MSAAAHMGAALQRNLQNMRRGGGSAPPVHGHRIFIKMSFRGAQRRGNPFSLCGEGAAQGTGYGLPHRCAHRFAMTRILLEVRCMSGGGSAPPVHGRRIFIKLSFRGAQRRGNPFPPCSEGAVGGVRIATPVCALVRNDREFFWGCGAYRRRGEGTPPYGECFQYKMQKNRPNCSGLFLYGTLEFYRLPRS